MSNGEHEIRTPKGLRIGNRSVVDFNILRKLLRSKDFDYVVNACDAG